MTNTNCVASLIVETIESLRAFATTHGELAFAHLCTAALAGEEWAVERVNDVFDTHYDMLALHPAARHHKIADRLELIRLTDTTRPDGTIARTLTTI